MPGPATDRARKTSKRVRTLPQVVVRSAAKQVSDALKSQARADTGGDLRLSGMGKVRFTTSTRVRGRDNPIATITPGPKCRGVASILEYGTKGHSIGARPRRKSKALRIGGQWITGPVTVRGAPARHSWSHGTVTGTPPAIRAANSELRKAIESG